MSEAEVGSFGLLLAQSWEKEYAVVPRTLYFLHKHRAQLMKIKTGKFDIDEACATLSELLIARLS